MSELFQMHEFLKSFFQENNCPIKKETNNHLTVQLTKEIDKAILNRPFYWHYKEWMKEEGVAKEITLYTNYMEEKKLDWITVASPMFDKMLAFLQTNNRYMQLYETIRTNEKTLLQPWLLINFSILYEGMQKREEIISIGLNLMNGAYQTNMMEVIKNMDFSPTISDYCYTISPLIRIDSAFKRLEKLLDDHVANQNHQWAIASFEEMKEQINMVHYFYALDEEAENKEKALAEVRQLLQPSISYDVINGGLIYLRKSFMDQNK